MSNKKFPIIKLLALIFGVLSVITIAVSSSPKQGQKLRFETTKPTESTIGSTKIDDSVSDEHGPQEEAIISIDENKQGNLLSWWNKNIVPLIHDVKTWWQECSRLEKCLIIIACGGFILVVIGSYNNWGKKIPNDPHKDSYIDVSEAEAIVYKTSEKRCRCPGECYCGIEYIIWNIMSFHLKKDCLKNNLSKAELESKKDRKQELEKDYKS